MTVRKKNILSWEYDRKNYFSSQTLEISESQIIELSSAYAEIFWGKATSQVINKENKQQRTQSTALSDTKLPREQREP